MYALILVLSLTCSSLSSGKCQEPSSNEFQSHPLHSACYGVVNYPYYSPDGRSLGDLNERAISQLSLISRSILPDSCHAAYKRAVCSTVFLPCHTGKVRPLSDGNTSTTYSVQFERPCLSLCTDIETSCLGHLPPRNLLNCSYRIDYSFKNSYVTNNKSEQTLPSYIPNQYDHSNDRTVCNSMEQITASSPGVALYFPHKDNSENENIKYNMDSHNRYNDINSDLTIALSSIDLGPLIPEKSDSIELSPVPVPDRDQPSWYSRNLMNNSG